METPNEYIDKEHISMQSRTRPNEAYTMSELVTRSAQGLPLTVKTFVPMYYGEELPNLRRLDMSEAAEIIKANRQKIKEVTDAINKRRIDAQNLRLSDQLKAKWELEQSEKAQLEKLQQKYTKKTEEI